MAADMNRCNSCLMIYNSRDRVPKVLSCYHMYCKFCIDEYMFTSGIVICLSCGKETIASSLQSLAESPYFGSPAGGEGTRNGTGPVEEVYYSDSDEESSSPSSRIENGVSDSHVQGCKDMVMNTQKDNVAKVKQLLQSNLKRIQSSRAIAQAREELLKESIQALTDFKNKVQDELKSLQGKSAQLAGYENKLNSLRLQIDSLDLMDFAGLKAINEESLSVKQNLNQETEKARLNDLDKAIRQSRVKILFETSEPLLLKLKAENDRLSVKLNSSLQSDPSLVFLTTFLLSTIFAEKISTENLYFKELIKMSNLEEGAGSTPVLDDPTEYIDYIKSFQNMRFGPAASGQTRSQSPRENAPDDTEWKVVGNKEKKEVKKTPLSFSEMAKRPGNPKLVKRIPFPEKTIAQTNRPHSFFKIQVDNDVPFRVVFELRPDMAPRMVDNFTSLCKGLPDGRGYKGSKIFRAKADDHILGGDFENDDGTGGHSAYDEKYFLAEQCPLKDHKGAIRMKGLERTADGRCRIGSQFMIWVGDLEYKEYKFTLVFGKVVEGFDKLLEVSRIKAVQKSPTSWVLRQTVTIVDAGIL